MLRVSCWPLWFEEDYGQQDPNIDSLVRSFALGGHGALQMLCVAARWYIELACGHRNVRAMLLALDWKGAFDSINPEALVHALKRFGIGTYMSEFIGYIHRNQRFKVCENGDLSSGRSHVRYL